MYDTYYDRTNRSIWFPRQKLVIYVFDTVVIVLLSDNDVCIIMTKQTKINNFDFSIYKQKRKILKYAIIQS